MRQWDIGPIFSAQSQIVRTPGWKLRALDLPRGITELELRRGIDEVAQFEFGLVTAYDLRLARARSGDQSAIFTFNEEESAAVYFDVCFGQTTIDRPRRGRSPDYDFYWRLNFLDAGRPTRH